MTITRLAKIVNDCMSDANVAPDEIELGKITDRLWTAIEKYVTEQSTN